MNIPRFLAVSMAERAVLFNEDTRAPFTAILDLITTVIFYSKTLENDSFIWLIIFIARGKRRDIRQFCQNG